MSVKNRKWLVFLVVATGVFLSTLDSSMVNIALPSIMNDFQAPLHQTEWVVMAYLLTISTTLLFWGHLSDRLGRGRFYGLGFFVFGSGSLACVFSSTLFMLICSRFLQALGAAMMMANGPAIIREVFPPEKLGRSMGLIGVPVSLGLMCGPVLGGFLIELFSWRALFLLSLPISFSLALLSQFVLPMGLQCGRAASFDWKGAFWWCVLLVSICLCLTFASSSSASLGLALFWAFIAAASLVFFVRVERGAREPVLPLLLLRKRFFTIGVVSALLSFLILFSVLILMPFYLDLVLKLTPSGIGFVMMSIPVTALIVAPLAGWLSDFLGARILSTLGLFFSTIGILLVASLTPETGPVSVAARLSLFGIGQATFLSPNSASVLGRLANKNSGTAAALLATARNVGMMLGIALAGLSFSFFFRMTSGGMELDQFVTGSEGDFCQALRYCFFSLSFLGVGAVLLSWQRPVFSGRKVEDDAIK